MRYRHILWDWNGTLLDDAALGAEIINGILASRGLPQLELAQYQEVFDFPVIDYYRRVGLNLTEEPFEVIAAEYIEHYERRCLSCTLKEDAMTVLNTLMERGYTQSILSASHQDSLGRFVRHFGIEGYFQDLIGLEDHYAQGKVERGRQWMAASGFRRGEVLMIGDTIHDFETAQAIGAKCLLVARGHHSMERLLTCQVPVAATLKELLTPGWIL